MAALWGLCGFLGWVPMGWSYADWNGPFYPAAGPGKQAITL